MPMVGLGAALIHGLLSTGETPCYLLLGITYIGTLPQTASLFV